MDREKRFYHLRGHDIKLANIVHIGPVQDEINYDKNLPTIKAFWVGIGGFAILIKESKIGEEPFDINEEREELVKAWKEFFSI